MSVSPRTLLLLGDAEACRRPILGLSLVQRLVLTAQQAGLERVVLLVPEAERERVLRAFAEHPRSAGPPPVIALESLPAGLAPLGLSPQDEVLLGRVDRVWLRGLLESMQEPLGAAEAVALACRGLQLPEREEDWAGLLRLRATALEAAVGALRAGVHALRRWARETLGDEACALRTAEGSFELLRSEGDLGAAEDLLLGSLVKKTDGAISRNINRKISLTISRQLARLPVLPNHVTGVVLLLGLASGPIAARGDHWGFALGGFLYYLGAILDGCDGEISRLKFLGSALGTWLDTITDDLSALSFLIGLYWGLHTLFGGWIWALLGIVAVAGNLTAVILRYRILLGMGTGDHQKLSTASRREPETPLERAVDWVRWTVFRTDFLPFFAFVCGLLGIPWLFAVPYAPGAVAAAVDSVRLTLASPAQD